MDSWVLAYWPLFLAVTAWIAVGILAVALHQVEASLEKWKTKVAMLETGVSMRGDLIVKKQDALEQRIAGVEALLVSTVGQETEEFCRAMDGIMDRMETPAPAPKVTLSEEHVGRFAKKGKGRG